MINIKLPSQLAVFVEGERNLSLDAETLGGIFEKLDEMAPMIRSQIFDRTGSIRQFVGIFVNGRQIAEIGDGRQQIAAGSELVVLMSVAGG